MSRTTVVWIAISLMALAAGCRMCASPYDYCSPTFIGTCDEDCAPFVRAGSILSGQAGRPPLPAEDYVEEHLSESEEIARIQVDHDSASPIVVSETDGEMGQPAEQAPTLAVEEGPTLAVEESPTSTIELDPLPSDGWKAAKRRTETVQQ